MSGSVTLNEGVTDIGAPFSTTIPAGTELVIIAHSEFDDQDAGIEKLDDFTLSQDGVVVTQVTTGEGDEDYNLQSQGGANHGSNYAATLLWRVTYAEQPPVYQLASVRGGGSDGMFAVSKIIAFTSVNEGRLPGPNILEFVGADPDGTIDGEFAGYSNGDTLSIKFDKPTNRPSAANKVEIDDLLDFSASIGQNYVGSWRSPTNLVLTILDADSNDDGSVDANDAPNVDPDIDALTVILKAGGKLRDKSQTSLISTDRSPRLTADFVSGEGPLITSITADDPNGGPDTGFSDGDIVNIRFSEDTNQPLKEINNNNFSQEDIDSLFIFTQNSQLESLGVDYTGTWINEKTFRITIIDAGTASPVIGAFLVTVIDPDDATTGDGLQNLAGTSLDSISTSPPLVGTWGTKLAPEIILLEATDPDGSIQVPEFGNGDVITAIFSEDTNMPPFNEANRLLNTAEIDSLFDYKNDDGLDNNVATLGTSYSGIWLNPFTLEISIDDVSDGDPTLEQFTFTITPDDDPNDGLNFDLTDADGLSDPADSTSVLLSGSFGQLPGPEIATIEAADPKSPPVAGFDAEDTITVTFFEETNRENAAKKAEIDSMFDFSELIGADYIGSWKNSKVFVITILDADSDGDGDVDADDSPDGLVITVTQTGIQILNKEGSSDASDSISPELIGSFGLKDGPLISSLIANDPNGVGEDELGGYNTGDTITVRFSEPTNTASFGVGTSLSKADLKGLFIISQEIGDGVTAEWLSDRILEITIVDDSVDLPPEVGVLRFTVKEEANLKDSGNNSQPSTSQSPTLTGSFGIKEGPTILSITAADPFNLTPSYGDRDTITVLFSETTNRPFFTDDDTALTKDDVDGIFEFSDSLGDDYEGQWITPAVFLITILNSNNNENPQPNSFSLSLKLTANLKDEAESSLVSIASSPLLTGTFGSLSAPVIFSVQASIGDIIIMTFEDATNGSGTLSKSALDSLFDYKNDGVPAELGTAYTGTWITPFELEIEILNTNTPTPPVVGEFQFDVKDSTIQLLNAQETSSALTGLSPVLIGSFDQKVGPEILSITADDPNNLNDSYSIGDTITIQFSEPTNTQFYDPLAAAVDPRLLEPGVPSVPDLKDEIDDENRTLTKDEVDTLFRFTQDLGDGYIGFWDGDSTFVITVTNDQVDIPPEIGSFQIIVRESGDILNISETSLPSISISPTLTGSFGTFKDIISIALGAVGYTKLPSGLSSSIQLPDSVSGKMLFERLLEDGEINNQHKTQLVMGVSVDIDPSDGASCLEGCIVTFEFTTEDAAEMGLKPRQVKILHDLNGDGDFTDWVICCGDPNPQPEFDRNTIIELIDDNGTPGTSPDAQSDDRWRATGTSFSNSKFAVGGVKALAVGAAYSSVSTIQETKFVSLGNPNIGLGGSLQNIDLNSVTEPMIFQTDETLVFRIGMFEQQGINYVQHAALYLNNVGEDLRSSDYDTSIVFDKYSEELITTNDPNNLLKHSEFKLLARDATYMIVQFSLTFENPMDTSNLYFLSWNEDKNPTYKTYDDVLTIIPLSAEYQDKIDEGVEEYLEPTFDSTEELLIIDTSIPYWVKAYVKGWSEGTISDSEFFNAIKYLIDEDESLKSTFTIDTTHSEKIPNWIKQYTRWWVNDNITNEDFISVISHLVKTGVILNTHQFKILDDQNTIDDFRVDINADPEPTSALKAYVKGWSEDTISDSEFFNAIQYLIDDDESLKSTFTIDTTNSTEIPNWIKQYARWLVADDITEENFISILGHLVKTGVILN